METASTRKRNEGNEVLRKVTQSERSGLCATILLPRFLQAIKLYSEAILLADGNQDRALALKNYAVAAFAACRKATDQEMVDYLLCEGSSR